MLSIVITERGGSLRQLDFDAPELTIGRLEENEIVLPRGNVSKRHARLQMKDGRYVLLDLKSTNGTYVNGRKVTGPTVLAPGDKVYIGDFVLALREARSGDTDTRRTRELRPLEGRTRANQAAAGSGEQRPPRVEPTTQLSFEPPRVEAEPAEESAPQAPRRTPPSVPHRTGQGGARSAFPQPWALKNAAGRTLSPAAPVAAGPRARRDSSSANALSATLKASSPSADALAQTTPAAGPVSSAAVAAAAELTEQVDPVSAVAAASAERSRDDGERSAGNPALISGEWPKKPPARIPTPPYGVEVPQSLRSEVVGRAEPEAAAPPTHEPASASPMRLAVALQTLMERLASEIDVTEPREGVFGAEPQLSLERQLDQLAREGLISPDVDRPFLVQAAISEAVGLGPLDRLLNQRALRELVVQGPSRILADLGTGLAPVTGFFSSAQALTVALRRLCARAGRELGGEASQELWLPDGSSISILQAPLAPRGPVLSLRRPPRPAPTLDQLVQEGVLSGEMVELLKRALELRLNVLLLGGPGSGVSTLLGALASSVAEQERVVAIEAQPSLGLRNPHFVALRSGYPGAPPLADLLHHAARLRAERLVVDDLSPESLGSVLIALAGLRGVLGGMHVQVPASGAGRSQLERFAFGHACPIEDPAAGAAFQLRVQLSADGAGRKVIEISELCTSAGGELDLVPLFRYDGDFRRTGRVASFIS